MYVEVLLQKIDNISPSIVDEADKIDWINQLEDYVYSEIVEKQKSTSIDLVKDQDSYDLGNIIFNDILKVEVNGAEYKRMNLKDNIPSSYFQDGDNITINPIPDKSNFKGIKIIHKDKPTPKELETSATDKLSIVKDFGLRYEDLYINYILYKICISTEEYGKANNYISLFNQDLADFSGWYHDNMPNTTIIKRARRWR